jgi:hypothetical protein
MSPLLGGMLLAAPDMWNTNTEPPTVMVSSVVLHPYFEADGVEHNTATGTLIETLAGVTVAYPVAWAEALGDCTRVGVGIASVVAVEATGGAIVLAVTGTGTVPTETFTVERPKIAPITAARTTAAPPIHAAFVVCISPAMSAR